MAPQPERDAFWYLPQHLSVEHAAALGQLKAALRQRCVALAPTCDDDLSLLRFLKARHWDVARAAQMYSVRRRRARRLRGRLGGLVVLCVITVMCWRSSVAQAAAFECSAER